MKINKTMAIVLFGLLAAGLVGSLFLTQRLLSVNAAPPAQEQNETGEAEDSDEAGDAEDDDSNEADKAEEATVSPAQTGITADEAKAAAEAAYPGAKTLAVELERENGRVIYEVELDNGLEVIVAADRGDVLGAEQD
jgi:uncharacterized membrane protein YkoI